MADERQLQSELAQWMRKQPKLVKQSMRLFPPGAVVKANRPLTVPAPGKLGVVRSYFADGLIGVNDPNLGITAQCQRGWLEIVEYHGDMDAAMVAAILDGPE